MPLIQKGHMEDDWALAESITDDQADRDTTLAGMKKQPWIPQFYWTVICIKALVGFYPGARD